jgi:Microfibril-associated/Pre-mRNA processing
MDEDTIKDAKDVRLRDNTAATGEDKFRKEAMPKIMQVRATKATDFFKYLNYSLPVFV